MKRFILFSSALVSALTLLLAVTSPVFAVDLIDNVCQPNASGQTPEVCADNSTTETSNPIYGENGIVTKALRIFLLIFGVTALFVLLINAVRMVSSMGDSKSFESARNGIIYAAVGIVIAISANFIVSFIVTKIL